MYNILPWDARENNYPTPRPSDVDSYKFVKLLAQMSWSGLEYTAWAWFENNRQVPLGVGGFIQKTPTSVDAFIILSQEYKQHPFTFQRIVKRKFKEYLEKNPNVKTVFSYIDRKYPEREKWVQRLGFKKIESTIRKYNIDWQVYQWDS